MNSVLNFIKEETPLIATLMYYRQGMSWEEWRSFKTAVKPTAGKDAPPGHPNKDGLYAYLESNWGPLDKLFIGQEVEELGYVLEIRNLDCSERKYSVSPSFHEKKYGTHEEK